ncbi:MAG TPA: protease inhibitor I42 family protein [Saprospiraceae bacterium]|nr:protease inhibitor I42 family protein [Saprospiraceae bacterium]HMW40427.1 protease inhibitor I42 family protein [Saprospiraceae bacterium]HMX89655.1 protease inhibitor I42 family protein [Saprospiraceae bacterium]HMZ41364.1 protease inhibitor I42 family protein [Saprospiraceae bacterium]HNA65342.1 protease inhibitor I42 family protein [Saprospiraceae bacterium]
MKLLMIFLSSGLMLCNHSLAPQEKNEITISVCDTTVKVKPNSSVTILRPITLGTGYKWQIVSQSNPAIFLKQIEEFEVIQNNDDKDGENSFQILKLRSTEVKGVDTVLLHYFRSFEKGKIPEAQCKIIFIAK